MIIILFVSAALLPLSASACHYTFNSALIDGGKGNVDVSLFNEGLQLSGTYNVTVTVNGNTVDSDVAVPFRHEQACRQGLIHEESMTRVYDYRKRWLIYAGKLLP
ncbi:hypothetical protein FNI43_23830 [Salmonella enterica subsp. diarizonae]|uniref:FimD/PapC N-terminal domain-containing protein n=1 Tax=Salmonella enterica TaxID=28901 RepID=UPI0012805061|nr:hypothetical protein [Salmonella enterica]EBW8860945.1 hypothetical protein [Salmonella enterica subsp. enterica serovar Muenchen]ECE0793781.1 hypothetical protein [Salmonella enterica subsp. diarizonae]ECF5937867.1 hypothetical protein [Salmonella enterica subsp. diarizonae]ECI5661066.1 hypothetical protein [Salmonella enterica subsp. diarizonae]